MAKVIRLTLFGKANKEMQFLKSAISYRAGSFKLISCHVFVSLTIKILPFVFVFRYVYLQICRNIKQKRF